MGALAETTAAAQRRRPPRAPGVVFGLVFAAVGLAALIPFIAVPVGRMVRAQSWTVVPCTIIESAVQGDGETYRVVVRYSYEAGGAARVGTRYQFTGGSSSGWEGKQRVVDRLTPGSTVRCYVNPRDPEDAVIERGPTGELAFGLIPLVFVAVGLFFARSAARARAPTETERARVATGLPADAGGTLSTLPRTLRQGSSPAARFVAMVIVSLFWNGIVSIFVRELVGEWQRGQAPVFGTLFLTPFVAAGVFLIAKAGQQMFMMVNPRAQVTLTPGTLVAGETATVAWTLTGKVERISALTVTLEGREQATYVRGTDRRTDTAVFARIPVGPAREMGRARQGMGRVEVPAGVMHSFVSSNNRIEWVVRVHGQIDRWPDLDEEYPVTVLPRSELRG
jgi:hypothetical protein